MGSVGVISESPNLHKLLKNNDVAWTSIKAGEKKRSLEVFVEQTEEGLQTARTHVDLIHKDFMDLVERHRKNVDMGEVRSADI